MQHVTADFIVYLSTTIREYAATLGKTNFYIVGEVAGDANQIVQYLGKCSHNPQNPDSHPPGLPALLTAKIKMMKSTYLRHDAQPYPGLTGVFDFAHGGSARDGTFPSTHTLSLFLSFLHSFSLSSQPSLYSTVKLTTTSNHFILYILHILLQCFGINNKHHG